MNSIGRIFLIFILIGCFFICPVILNAALVPIGITSNFTGIASSPFMNYFNQFNNLQFNSYGSNNLGFTNNVLYLNLNFNSYTSNNSYGLFSQNQSFGMYNPGNMNLFNRSSNQFNLSIPGISFNNYSPWSFNTSRFSSFNNSLMLGPVYNLNMWQNIIPLNFLTQTQTQNTNTNSNSGQTVPQIAQPTTRGRALASLQPVADCDELLAQLKAAAIQEMEERIDGYIEEVIDCGGCCNTYVYYPFYYSYGAYSGVVMANAPQTDSASPKESASDYSTTNVQVAGVDEADFIKNDGSYIYILADDKFLIIDAWPPEDANIISTVEIEGIAKKLFVDSDRAMIYSGRDYIDSWANDSECTYGYNCDFTGDNRKLKITILDISDRTNPVLLREIRFGGSYIESRRVGTAVHTVVFSPAFFSPEIKYWPELYDQCRGYYYNWLYYDTLGYYYDKIIYDDEPTLEELLAAFEELKEENRRIIEESTIADWLPGMRDTIYAANGEIVSDDLFYDCSNFYETDTPDRKSFLSIVSLDIDRTEGLSHVKIFGNPGAVYSSHTAMYISSRQQYRSGFQWFYDNSAGIQEASTVHKFRLRNEYPAGSEYAGSGVVKGRVLNQFAMDEYEGYLRMATTTGHPPSASVHSTMSIFEEQSGGELKVVGQVDQIAPTEDIRSVRFDGPKGFVVTFKKTDPLFAFDLSNPNAPAIAGELKIPGYSTYIHLLDDDHLLTIGYDSDDMGSFAWFQGIMLQIFDVSDMSEPVQLHKWVIGTRGSTSDAATNHLAFNYFAPKQMLAIPITICEGGSGGSYGTDMTFSGLIVFDVSITNGFSEHGRVMHQEPCPDDCRGMCTNWWTNSNSTVKRSIFMDDFIYSVAMDKIVIQDLDYMGLNIGVVNLP